MSQQNNIFEQVKNVLDIVSEISVFVDLNKKGRNYWGICPFHDDTSPSMSVSPEKQMFKCFVCQVGGSVINFISQYEKISFVEATKRLADKAGIPFTVNSRVQKKHSENDQKIFLVLDEAMNFFQYSLSTDEGTKASEYLKKRGINQHDIDRFSIGYAPNAGLINFLKTKEHDESSIINASLATERLTDFFKDRIIFGIKNNEGQVVGFSARTLNQNEKSKYINSADTTIFNKKEILYNYSIAAEAIRRNKEIIITEGFMDVIALYKAEIFHSVAIMGTALTPEHIKLLKNKTIVMMLDPDDAGIAATIKSIKTILPVNQNIYVIDNEFGLDPDEILKQKGVVELQQLTQKRVHALEYIFKKHIEKFGTDSPEKADAFIKSFIQYLGNVDTTYKDFYVTKLSQVLGISKDTIEPLIIPIKNIDIKKPFNSKEYKYIDEGSSKIQSNSQIDQNKWARQLLSAMLNKPTLIQIYETSHVNFLDPMLQVMGGYIIQLRNGVRPNMNEKVIDELKGIKAYLENQEKLKESEFKDLIKVVNKIHRKQTVHKYANKINDENTSQQDKIKILEEMGKLIKGREE